VKKLLVHLLVLGLWGLPLVGSADDCDETIVQRNSSTFTVKRILLADGKTTNTTSTKCVPPSRDPIPSNTGTVAPWDFYVLVAEEGNTCALWNAVVRHYPINATATCRGTCDPHTLFALDKTGTTDKIFSDPLGEAMDVVTTGVTCSGGVSIFADFYYRNQGK